MDSCLDVDLCFLGYSMQFSSGSFVHPTFPSTRHHCDTYVCPICLAVGPPMANVSVQSNNPQVVEMGVFASASFATLKMKKEVELWEVCHTMLPKVPRAYSKVTLLLAQPLAFKLLVPLNTWEGFLQL